MSDHEPGGRHPLYDSGSPTYNPPPKREGPQQPSPIAAVQQPILTYALIAINVAIYAIGLISQDAQIWLLVNGWADPQPILEGLELHRLFTAMFLHSPTSPLHIALNMYALYIFGRDVELIFGHVRFAIIYFLGGLAGSILSVTLGDFSTPSVGASGAIFAVWAAQALFVYRNRQIYGSRTRSILMNMALVLGFNLLLGFTVASIDNWGHIGGFIGGAILTWFIGPSLRIYRQLTPAGLPQITVHEQNPLSNRSWQIVGVYTLGCGLVLLFAILFIPGLQA